ncbi:ribosome biogenesis GTPase Der [Oceanidesulfovibrio marinus]|uniref:GTPase Der n=1 Tax=Oceanidesulfovibrio marinus TaxID=370038 RepID=A0A6P1ZGW6_9BACT|nr:ribosome biogenesis GTPase Der [Oceanidesulfovibrio marinus]TVM34244.1 ribosome biogenesis GTPase Der [Oceanidesulfovibrio marinus]
MQTLPLVALIGRPNVGKSTMFNRMVGRNRAITHDRPGVTRDRMYGEVRRKGERDFGLVDTGGFALDDAGESVRWDAKGPEGLKGFEAEVYEQARIALDEADVLVLVVDGREGMSPLDARLADHLRGSGKPVLLAVNKVDGEERESELTAEFYALGLEPIAVSAAHGMNMNGLLDAIRERLPEEKEAGEEGEEPGVRTGLRIAMLGRPNAGKSSLVNRFVGGDRMIVSELAGTTRDSVDVVADIPLGHRKRKRGKPVAQPGEPEELWRFTFVDTAGVRRRTKITDEVEQFTVQAALKSARKADVAVLVIDALGGVAQQDKKLISYLDREKIAFLVFLNKMDMVEPAARKKVVQDLESALSICPHVPKINGSALTGYNVDEILTMARSIHEEAGTRISTGVLNRAMSEALSRHQAPVVKRRRAKFYYMTQTDVHPATFVFFVNDPERVKDSYAKYLENQLRKLLGLPHAPLKVLFRPSHGGKE